MGYHEKEGENAIVIQNLVKKFEDVTAVNGLDLTVKKGEIFGLLGPNGAGKTTVINILCGLLPATSGSAYVGGYDVKDQNDNTKKPITFGLAVARYLMFIISAITIIGALLPFFRKDKKTLQDVLMQTTVVRLS